MVHNFINGMNQTDFTCSNYKIVYFMHYQLFKFMNIGNVVRSVQLELEPLLWKTILSCDSYLEFKNNRDGSKERSPTN